LYPKSVERKKEGEKKGEGGGPEKGGPNLSRLTREFVEVREPRKEAH